MKPITKVTVLMPAYNVEKYIREAIQSILNQTYVDFFFLIINDASNDSTEDIILSFSDPRIIYVKNPSNFGLGKTLELGINLINTKYVVRFDADDISLPKRLEEQVKFMDQNPSLALAFPFFEVINGIISWNKRYEDKMKIRTRALFECSILHPGLIINNEFLKRNKINYNSNLQISEDYDLYLEVLKNGDIGIIPEVLVKYRLLNTSTSSTKYELQMKNSTELRCNHLKILTGLSINDYEKRLYLIFSFYEMFEDAKNLKELKTLLAKVRKAYFSQNTYAIDKRFYIEIEYEKLKILLIENKSLGFPLFFEYLKHYSFDFNIFFSVGLGLRILKYKLRPFLK